MMHRWLFAAALACAAFVPDRASAGETPSFGRAGTVVLEDVVGAGVVAAGPATPLGLGVGGAVGLQQTGWLSFGSLETGGGHTRYVRVAPSFDVFVADGPSIGARVAGGVTRLESLGSNLKVWDATVAPRVGYAFELADDVTAWPRIGAALTVFDGPGLVRTGAILRVPLEVPFVFRLSRRVAFDVGPELAYVRTLSGPLDVRGVTGGVRGGLSLVF